MRQTASFVPFSEISQHVVSLSDGTTEAFLLVLERMHETDRMLLVNLYYFYDQRRKAMRKCLVFYRKLRRNKLLHPRVRAKIEAIIADLQTIPVQPNTPPG